MINDEKDPSFGIEPVIRTLRGMRIILDSDLARVYGVPTKAFNQAVKRNITRFPPDFLFQLSSQESAAWIASAEDPTTDPTGNRSQIVTGSQRHRDPRSRPWAFTEHGAIMAAGVLNSRQAVQMSVFVVRAFIKMREQLMERVSLEGRLSEIEKHLLGHDAALRDLYRKIRPLLLPSPDPPKRKIGFLSENTGK